MMVANDLIELSLRDGEVEINLRRPNPNAACSHAQMSAPVHGHHSPVPVHQPNMPDVFVKGEVVEVGFHEIRSPMVGTFYASPDPESPAFIQVGSHVGPSTVVCILEAMKVFSEIKAETTGVIERVLARDGQAVEYGQPLFLVRPA